MRVIEVVTYGGSEVLQAAEWPDPVAGDGKVRVRVLATTANPADLWTRAGAMAPRTPNATLPIVLGWEFAGELLDPAAGLEAGQRVAGLYPWFTVGDGTGTYAEIVLVEPAWITAVPDGADIGEAATVSMNGQTALQALRLIPGKPGQTVLITGASGAVGGFAVQLAAVAGAHVIAVASQGDEKFVSSLGAKEILGRDDLVKTVLGRYPDGVDAVVDAAAAGPELIGVVRDGGAYASVTDPSQPAPERGIQVGTVHTQPDAAGLADLLAQLAAGTLRTRIADTLPLTDAAEAHRRLEAGGLRGKLVLTV